MRAPTWHKERFDAEKDAAVGGVHAPVRDKQWLLPHVGKLVPTAASGVASVPAERSRVLHARAGAMLSAGPTRVPAWLHQLLLAASDAGPVDQLASALIEENEQITSRDRQGAFDHVLWRSRFVFTNPEVASLR